LRERRLDAVVIDARSLEPAGDLKTVTLAELPGAFMCRAGHPLSGRSRVKFSELQAFPVASTPLSDELARALVERYGPGAHPDTLVHLQCDEIASLVEVVRSSDAVLLSVCAAAPDLQKIDVHPPLTVPAKYALVTLARRTPTSTLALVKTLITSLLMDPR
jgi:DNA-binding transcriptional LysR family regulator